MPLSLEQLIHRLGGVASRAALVELTSRADVDRALREGRLVRLSRGRYALPTADVARKAAAAVQGVVSHRSAAAAWGWEMKRLPEAPCVTVPVKRRLTQSRRAGLELHWSQVEARDLVDGWLTSPGRTFVDCCRDLPFDEALAVADSALRRQDLSPLDLARLAAQMRGPGRTRADRVAKEATAAADNPFESVLRAIALDVPGMTVQPQVLVVGKPFAVRPDLVDEHLKLALEGDSFEWHGSRAALRRDCRRYNLLVAHGWRVLRFTWEDVMLDPQNVRQTLVAAVAVVRGQEEVRPATALPA